MNIILINPPSDVVTDDRLEPHLGLLYIAANILHEQVAGVHLYDMTGTQSSDDLITKIKAIPIGDVYGISCCSTNYHFTKQIIDHIRYINTAAYIVVGGPHPTAIPEDTFVGLGVDAVVCGEGEDEFVRLIRLHQAGASTKGVFWGVGRDNIDTYPFPAHHLVDYRTYTRRFLSEPVLSLISSRGCRHQCMHCNSVVMGGGNKKVRYRSTESILSEIQKYRDQFHCFRFNDDHFTGNPNLMQLLIGIKELKILYRVFARLDDLTEESCTSLASSGCRHITVGLESLNPDNLRILGKSEQIGQSFRLRLARHFGIKIRVSFMVGLPFDSESSIIESFSKAEELDFDEFAVYPLIPYPGTLLAQFPEKYGYKIIDNDFTKYVQMGRDRFTCTALQHRNFSQDDVRRWVMIVTSMLSKHAIHMSQSTLA